MHEDPQAVARDMIVETEHPRAGPVKSIGLPVKFSETPGGVTKPAPTLGQHGAAILAEHDVNILDIAALSVIVEEAGGVFTDLNGDAPTLETRSVLAANPAMHAQLLADLSGVL